MVKRSVCAEVNCGATLAMLKSNSPAPSAEARDNPVSRANPTVAPAASPPPSACATAPNCQPTGWTARHHAITRSGTTGM